MQDRCEINKVLLLIASLLTMLSCSLVELIPVHKDGCYIGYAKAWIDNNENGNWEEDEKPLQGVQFELFDGNSTKNYLYESISDTKGSHFMSTFPNTCESLALYKMLLRATPPKGYKATTPIEILLPKEDLLSNKMHDYIFGFISIDNE
jgi:hypothetical protein